MLRKHAGSNKKHDFALARSQLGIAVLQFRHFVLLLPHVGVTLEGLLDRIDQILISEGFVLSDEPMIFELGRMAAEARTSLYALKLDNQIFDIADARTTAVALRQHPLHVYAMVNSGEDRTDGRIRRDCSRGLSAT